MVQDIVQWDEAADRLDRGGWQLIPLVHCHRDFFFEKNHSEMLGLSDSEDDNPAAAMAAEEEGEENGILTSVSDGGLVDGGDVNESFELAEVDNDKDGLAIPVYELAKRSNVEMVTCREPLLHAALRRAKNSIQSQKTKN
jgi:hypothetical protein